MKRLLLIALLALAGCAAPQLSPLDPPVFRPAAPIEYPAPR